MELTRERALELHRRMWSDMQKELGNNPSGKEREWYKRRWVHKYFPDEHIWNYCFLCEYARTCSRCPIVWVTKSRGGCCTGVLNYTTMPISELLALPERKEV